MSRASKCPWVHRQASGLGRKCPGALAGRQPTSQANRKQEKTAPRLRGNPHWAPRRAVTQSSGRPATCPPTPATRSRVERRPQEIGHCICVERCRVLASTKTYRHCQILPKRTQATEHRWGDPGPVTTVRGILLKKDLGSGVAVLQRSTPPIQACSSPEIQRVHPRGIQPLPRYQTIHSMVLKPSSPRGWVCSCLNLQSSPMPDTVLARDLYHTFPSDMVAHCHRGLKIRDSIECFHNTVANEVSLRP